MRIPRSIRRLIRSRTGATAVEYALLIGVIGLSLVAVLESIGGSISSIIKYINTYLS